MRSRHCAQVDWLAIRILAIAYGAVAGIISEAVFDTNDDPVTDCQNESTLDLVQAGAYQRLVKTTPKPSATKNSSGELDPLSPRSLVGDGVALFVSDSFMHWYRQC